ncbi:tetratricopeptide repeat-containing sensor histidine kinase [Ancylomarina longa]|uniref:Signal transduction histidine kinase internal region domain-containing protein n=1 Tax=Ancylomarina longa TaxID=2487017 RepID=A0A434AUF1_9BACT|nr:tetratricopeptide repeat protein [Ancylomarina longa]RUT78052.1 hypothetical protein DLK05_10435 [Ancylomarina longa]
MKQIALFILLLCMFSNSVHSIGFFQKKNNSKTVILTDRVTEYLDSSKVLRNVSLEQSIEICQKAIKMAEELNNPELSAKAYKAQGINYYFIGNIDSSFSYYNKAIPQFEALKSQVDIGKVLGNIGLLYRKKGQYDKALEYYLKNFKIYEKYNYQRGMGSVLNNLGNLYNETGDLTNAEKYYQLALINFKKFKNTKEIANAYCNLGAVNEKRKEFKASLNYYKQSLEENAKLGNKLFESKLIFNIGFLYHAQGKLDSAFHEVKKTEAVRIQLGDQNGVISSKLEIAKILIDQKKYKEAESYLQEANQLAQKSNNFKWISEISQSLTDVYRLQTNFKKAFHYQTELIQIKDSLENKETTERYNNLLAKFETEQRAKEFELLQQRTQIQNLELDKKNAWITTLLVVLILGIVAVLVSLRMNRLRADHKIMDLRQKVLLTQMNPHFLFNSLTAIQSFILDDRNDEANNYLSRLASLVRGILENSRQEFVSLRTELNTLEDYIGLQKLRFENDIAYHFDVEEHIDPDAIFVPPMLAQPFVENALIHGQLRNNPNAEIQVNIFLTDNQKLLQFQIRDNGIGIEEAKKNEVKKGHKSLATSIALDRVKIYNFKSSKKMNFEIVDLKNIDASTHGTQVTYSIPVTIHQN